MARVWQLRLVTNWQIRMLIFQTQYLKTRIVIETLDDMHLASTPLKSNMESENQPLEKEIPFGNHHLQVPC